ncbi:aldo/keto reductase [Phytohabitans rumicis]|uniref:Oxidoreductase n=1 Tax=Phytohabitans rumicis TaxID=1076125 RepID=A0A6V8LA91_9ACTN|nr:aldo/keto reductase [Phytohabitans rumicis]GFJ94123.1 oxidoreductase [Phytohabitans rumicis]
MRELRLTRLGCGTASIGNHRVPLTDGEAAEILDAAWDAGIRHFDTAPHYGLGLSEWRLGQFLAGKPRDEYAVSTKVGRLLEPNPAGAGALDDEDFVVPAAYRRVWDFSAAGVRRSLEESLGRLGLDRVDVLYLHDPERWDLDRGLADGLPALVQLREEGLATAIGIGSMGTEALVAAARSGVADLLMVAGRYTLADQSGAAELLDACRANGVGIVAAAVFNGGLLAEPLTASSTFDYRPAPGAVVARARRIAEVCESFGVPLRAAALAYPLLEPVVRAVVVGANNPDQVRQNAADLALDVPQGMWERLRAEGLVA